MKPHMEKALDDYATLRMKNNALTGCEAAALVQAAAVNELIAMLQSMSVHAASGPFIRCSGGDKK